MLDLESLRQFRVIVEAGTVTAAAAELRISQPALSRRMHALERRLDLRLFDRTVGGLKPSVAGLRALPLVQDLVERAERTERALGELATGRETGFRIVCPEATVRGVIAPFVAATAAPVESTTMDLAVNVYARLVQRDLDLAVNTLPPPAGLRSRLVRHYDVSVHLPADHPLAAEARIDVERLRGERVIVISRGSGLRQVVDEALVPLRGDVEIVAEPVSSDLAMALAASGAGVCLDMGPERYGLVARPLVHGQEHVRMPMYAGWEADHFSAAGIEQLVDRLERWARQVQPLPGI